MIMSFQWTRWLPLRCMKLVFFAGITLSLIFLWNTTTFLNCHNGEETGENRIEILRYYLRMRAEMNGRVILMTTGKARKRHAATTPSSPDNGIYTLSKNSHRDRAKKITPRPGDTESKPEKLKTTSSTIIALRHHTGSQITSRSNRRTKVTAAWTSLMTAERPKIKTEKPSTTFLPNRETNTRRKNTNILQGKRTNKLKWTTETSVDTYKSSSAFKDQSVKISKQARSTSLPTTGFANKDLTLSTLSSISKHTILNLYSTHTREKLKKTDKITKGVIRNSNSHPAKLVTTSRQPLTSESKARAKFMASLLPTIKSNSSPLRDESFLEDVDQIGCLLPKLDPFHESVSRHMEIVKEKAKCPPNTNFGTVRNAVLMVNVSKASNVTIYFMRRHLRYYPDFYLDDSPCNRLPLITDRPNTLKEGAAGCLVVNADKPYILHLNEKSEFVFSADISCKFTDMVHFIHEGQIKHVATNQCLKLKDVDNTIKEFHLVKECQDATKHFRILANTMILLDDRPLGMIKRNNSETKLVLRDKNYKGEGIKFSLLKIEDTDGIKAIPMRSDGAQLIVDANGVQNSEFFLTVKPLLKPFKALEKQTGWPLNVVMILIDSQSASNFKRLMPKTVALLQSHSTSFLMEGHSVVGDATAPQLAAILTGIALGDLPEARRDKSNGKSVDSWPLLFKDFHENGYVTLHSEDDPLLGAFNYALYGYDKQPTDHYGRAFWLAATKGEYVKNPTSCLMNKFMHQYSFDYLDSFFNAYPDKAKFAFLASSYLAHDEPNKVQYADDDIVNLFQHMNSTGRLNNTLMMIFGDHGSRLGRYRDTIQGRLEERLPFVAITVPERWKQEHPDVIKNLKHNSQILTSQFDFYATLKHTLSQFHVPYMNRTFGQSLFQKLDHSTRTCAKIGIEEAWCPCLQHVTVNTTANQVIASVNKALGHINTIARNISAGSRKCSEMTLSKILKAIQITPNRKVQEFDGTEGDHRCGTCKVMLSKSRAEMIKSFTYIVTFQTEPSGAIYEAKVNIYNEKITIQSLFRRLDDYMESTKCAAGIDSYLRKFCHCKQ